MSDAGSKVAADISNYSAQVAKSEKKRIKEQLEAQDEATRRACRIQQEEVAKLQVEYQSANLHKMTDEQLRQFVREQYGFNPI
jgi:hypothetical protein